MADQVSNGLQNILRRIDDELLTARARHIESTCEVERLEHQRSVVNELLQRRE